MGIEPTCVALQATPSNHSGTWPCGQVVLEPSTGIEPASTPYHGAALPLSYKGGAGAQDSPYSKGRAGSLRAARVRE